MSCGFGVASVATLPPRTAKPAQGNERGPRIGPGNSGDDWHASPRQRGFYGGRVCHLFSNPEGLFARYFSVCPDEGHRIVVTASREENSKMFAVTIPPDLLNAAGQFPSLTPKDKQFFDFRQMFGSSGSSITMPAVEPVYLFTGSPGNRGLRWRGCIKFRRSRVNK